MKRKRSAFLAVATPHGDANLTRPAQTLPFQTTVETERHSVTVYFTDAPMLTESATEDCVLLVAGDIYVIPENAVGATLIAAYRRVGPTFVKDIHGAFALLLIDRRGGQIFFATDRQNSIKLFTSWQGESLTVSNSLYLHPVQGRRVDRTAVATYLASMYIYNQRTLFESVEMLDSATVYRLSHRQLDGERYWRYAFSQSPRSDSLETLKAAFGELLVQAVGRRLRPNRPIYLSLTAGYDGCALMGVLASHYNVADVRTFTYAHGPVFRADSDESLGAKLAALVGYRHEIVEAFDGNAVSALKRNGQLGGGMTRLCDEVDAWVRLGAEVADGPLPVLYTGDTLQLGGNWPVNSFDDIASSARLREFEQFPWLRPFIGDSTYREFVDATHNEVVQGIERIPHVPDGRDTRQMVRFDQAHSRATLTWREYYAGRYFEPVHPLLDNDVVDFILSLPYAMRDDRKLYKATVTSMFPELFKLPRASTASYATYWPSVIRQQSAALQAWIRGTSSPLDDVIEPDILLALLSADNLTLTQNNVRLTAALRRVYHWIKRRNLNRNRFSRPWLFKNSVPVERFLTSALVMRSFLSETA